MEKFISRSSTNYDNLKSLIGKLENVIIMVKMMGHFMNSMYALEMKACNSDHNVRISKNAKEDAALHIQFLKQAEAGINMNILVYRKPNYITIRDACEHGLGGFHVNSGIAWTYEIPTHLWGRAHINLLEFLTH